MNKYISPIVEIENFETVDIVLASDTVANAGYTIKPLEGVDTGDDKSAVVDIQRWL